MTLEDSLQRTWLGTRTLRPLRARTDSKGRAIATLWVPMLANGRQPIRSSQFHGNTVIGTRNAPLCYLSVSRPRARS